MLIVTAFWKKLFLCIFFFSFGAHAYTPEAIADQVTNLPGTEGLSIPFNQFSGYLHIDGVAQGSMHMHYWYVETSSASSSPEEAPLVLWTNGGPGCSGLFGMLTELGPFYPNKDKTLSLNPLAWTKLANFLFIESPCGVGFSYSDYESDLYASDNSTAMLNYRILQAFYLRFPERINNDLYLASESYGGHYIPILADTILTQNAFLNSSSLNAISMPLKGFLVGNPYTDTYSAFPAMIETFWGHSLLPKPFYDVYSSQCLPFVLSDNFSSSLGSMCSSFIDKMLNFVGDYNPYGLDFDNCLEDSSKYHSQRRRLLQHITPRHFPLTYGTNNPCEDNYLHAYLNNLSVKAALHVKDSISWSDCSDRISYERNDLSTAPLYTKLLQSNLNLRILVFSGSDDAVCSTLGTQRWIFSLPGLTRSSSKYWKVLKLEGQIAGYLTEFTDDRIKFLVVSGAGHEVPYYTPVAAFDLFQRFLSWNWTL